MSYKICTSSELKEFANSETDLTVVNFAAWIESKTNQEYTIVTRAFIIDVLKSFKAQELYSTKSNDEFKEKWWYIFSNIMQ